ncbi:MAG TPA: HNH endonuclease signature motif containing protein, partial [Actinomycetota bacterium]|nr:HNH endonuclease signature motif containing protein [Actinomycetota bacterium]
PGVGPIPVAAARAMMADGFLAAIVTDGQDVQSVSHLGRTVHARVRTALFERDQGCVVPGCNDAGPLAIDHISEYHLGGPTAIHNLCLLCKWHHYLKTHHGHTIRRLHGKWLWEGPKGGPPTEQPWQSGLPTMPRMWNQDRLGPPPPKRRRRPNRVRR